VTLKEPDTGAVSLIFTNIDNTIAPTNNNLAKVGVMKYVFEIKAMLSGFGIFA